MYFPHDIWEIINSFLYVSHPFAIKWQRDFKIKMYNKYFVPGKNKCIFNYDNTMYKIISGGFTTIYKCEICNEIDELWTEHGDVYNLNIKIKNACVWDYKDMPVGYHIKFKCLC